MSLAHLTRSRVAPILAMAFIIVLSLYVRHDNFARPLEGPFETPMAMNVVTADAWLETPKAVHAFTPLLTYQGSGNLYISSSGMRSMDGHGRGYYTSAPPLSFMIPYFFGKLFQLKVTIELLSILNLLASFLASFFLYKLLFAIGTGSVGAIVGSLSFIFFPLNLWLFQNIYGWHVAWIYLWIPTLLLYLSIFDGKEKSRARIFILGSLSFAICYTDFQAFLIVLALIFGTISFPAVLRKKVGLALTAGALLSITATLVQYSIPLSLNGALHSISSQAINRSALHAPGGAFITIIDRYYSLFTDHILLLLAGITFLRLRRRKLSISSHKLKLLLFITLTPILFQHIIFLNWTAFHPCSLVRATLPVAIFTGIVFDQIFSFGMSRKKVAARALLALIVVMGIVVKDIDTYGMVVAWYSPKYPYSDIGSQIRTKSFPEEKIYVNSSIPMFLPVSMYAKRNFQRVSSLEEAREKDDVLRGVYFEFNGEGELMEETHWSKNITINSR
jgi:hypothetical protein